MKKILLYTLIVLLSLTAAVVITHHIDHNTTQVKLGIMSQNAYTTGCYHATETVCYQEFKDVIGKGKCLDLGLDFCPKAGIKFRKWITGK